MATERTKIRVLIAKPGLDTHIAGARLVARACRDAGMEVIYLAQKGVTIDSIVKTAIEEDVHVVGLSMLSGAHLTVCQKVLNKLKENNVQGVLVIAGGTIPDPDVVKLKQMGVSEVFRPGSLTEDIVRYIRENVRIKHNQETEGI